MNYPSCPCGHCSNTYPQCGAEKSGCDDLDQWIKVCQAISLQNWLSWEAEQTGERSNTS